MSVVATAAPATRPATRLAAGPATAPTTQKTSIQVDDEHRERTLALTRLSIQQLQAKQYKAAEETLTVVLALDPAQPTNLYNMACLQAVLGHSKQAMAYLQRSAAAGFTDFIHIERDPDLVSLHDLQKFKDFLASRNYYQHLAAEAVVTSLKHQFGDSYLYEIDDADKLVFATNTDNETIQALKKALVYQAHSQWEQLFENKPDQYIVVVVPSLKDYSHIVRQKNVDGFYNHSARTLIAKGLGFVTMHEFTHALHAADLDPLGQNHPIWLVEGMAVLFEHAEYEGDVLTPKENVRLYALQAEARQNHLIPWARLLTMPQREFVARAGVAYAETGSMMLYLYEQKLLRKYYDAVKANYDKDKTGKLAFEQVMGKPLAEIEKDWKNWMRGRTPPPMRTEPGGPFIGVQFGTATDGLKIEVVVGGGPASEAGLKVEDIVVGLNEADVRDLMTFMGILTNHKAGDTVTLRVRRGKEYLDVPIHLGKREANSFRPRGGRPTTKPAMPVPPTTRPTPLSELRRTA